MDAGRRHERDHRRSRVWRVHACAALLALALVCAIVPASGAATSENATATHTYLVAINSFEESELANQTQDLAAIEAVAARIFGECPGILANAPPHEEALGFGLLGPGTRTAPDARAEGERHRQARQLDDLELELSEAVADSRAQSDREAEVVLVGALTPLKWSNPKITFLLQLTVEAIKEELEIPAPPVCADMKAWVASGYETLSPASKEIASRSEALLKRAFEAFALFEQYHIQPFPKNLATYENAPDRALARRTDALTMQLKKGSETQAEVLKRIEATVGLPAKKVPKVKPPAKKPPVIARGRTAAGGRFVVRAEQLSRSRRRVGCTVNVTITEPSRPSDGLLEILSGEGTGRCLSRSHVQPEPAVHCHSGLLTVEANLLPTTRSVRLLLSDNHTITSPAIRVPARLGGPAGLYYQVVRGPSPMPVSLTELDSGGRTLTVLKLPAVVGCTKHPLKYFPGGIVRLAHGSLPHGPTFTIRAERYRKLGTVHFELKLEVSNEEPFGSAGQFETGDETGSFRRAPRVFASQTAGGCQPQPYVIVYGLLKAPRDTVFARVSGTLIPLRKVAIPPRLHAGGVLAFGTFSPLPTELLVRNASGRTVARDDISEEAKSKTETCEGEAED